jgi:molybdopterin synthase sulfur carrier subunit
MLKVLFFARIREELGNAEVRLDWSEAVADLDSLQAVLCRENGPAWDETLGQDNIIRAVNQTVADGNVPLQDGDEVAFFPPVTGG